MSYKYINNKLLSILKTYGVNKVFLASNLDYSYAKCKEGEIVIGLKNVDINNRRELLSTMFHEAAHIVNYNNNKYYKYHHDLGGKKYLRRIALRAERYTDKVGRKLMKEHYPDVRYLAGYRTKENQQWLRDYYK